MYINCETNIMCALFKLEYVSLYYFIYFFFYEIYLFVLYIFRMKFKYKIHTCTSNNKIYHFVVFLYLFIFSLFKNNLLIFTSPIHKMLCLVMGITVF